jgi:hypothetical protein
LIFDDEKIGYGLCITTIILVVMLSTYQGHPEQAEDLSGHHHKKSFVAHKVSHTEQASLPF